MLELLSAFLRPVHDENRRHLSEIREGMLPEHRGREQMIGRQIEHCGATIGAMPRCDFACTGCYLAHGANRTPPRSVAEVVRQMEQIRGFTGRWGNLQLTDGEVALRPEHELFEILAHARRLELLPMLMTHGEAFRRDPERLDRLVRAGLREIALHVDTTQRGRTRHWDAVESEAGLNPLRDELAELIRGVRRRTGLDLRAASTVTVTRESLPGVPDIVRWAVRNADAIRLFSFQPAAQVGRTVEGLAGGVRADELWAQVARGLGAGSGIGSGRLIFGHPECTRGVSGFVHERADGTRAFRSWRKLDEEREERVLDEWYRRFGGLKLRPDEPLVAAARVAGVVARAPLAVARHLPPYAWSVARRIGPDGPGRLLWRLLTGAERLRPLAFVSHHFMDANELASEEGRERLDACVFKVPHEGRMVSMCEANAGGLREAHYAELERRRPPRRRERSDDHEPAELSA